MEKKLLIILSLLLSVLSCTRHSEVSDTLAHADAVMEEYPDSALALLEAIPDSALVTSRDRALHALLLTQALDKNYIDVTSDSLINIAVNYFQNHGDRYEMLSHYYKGVIKYNSGDYRQSVISFLISRDFAESLQDSLFIAKTNEQLADLYDLTYDFQNEIDSRTKAIEAYRTCGKDKSIAYALVDLSISLYNNKEYHRAFNTLEKVPIDSYECDTILKKCYFRILGQTYIKLNKKEDALRCAEEILSLSHNDNLSQEEYALIVDTYLENGMMDSALVYAKLAQSLYPDITSHIDMQSTLLNLYLNRNDSIRLIEAYDSILISQNRQIREILGSQISQGRYDYYDIKSEKDERHISNAHLRIKLWAIGSFMLVLIIVILILYFKEKSRRNRLELDIVLHSLENELKSNHRKDIRELIKERFKYIESFSPFYGIDGTKPVKTEMLLSHINKTLAEFSNPDFIQSLEDILNRYQNNIMVEFKNLFPNLSPQQYRHMVYIFLGFSTSTISIFLHTSKSNIYTYRSKLKRMVLDKGSEVPDEIRKYFVD